MEYSTPAADRHGQLLMDLGSEYRCTDDGTFRVPLVRAEAAQRPQHLLESERKLVETEEAKPVRYLAKPCRCRSRFCPTCCLPLGLDLRKKLLEVLKVKYQSLQMWTLTIDPKLFKTQEDAFLYVRENKCVSEWVRSLRDRGVRSKGKWSLLSGDFFCVIEWQKNGMIHFHVLLNASFIPHDVALSSWGRFRPKDAGPIEGGRPAFGTVLFSEGDFKSKAHAARYACSYLIKNPEDGYPDWVLDMRREVKRFQASQGFWKLSGNDLEAKKPPQSVPAEKKEERSEGTRTTIRERISRCASETVILREEPIDGEGRPRFTFIRRISKPYLETLEFLGVEETHRGPVYVTPYQIMDLSTVAERHHQVVIPTDFGEYGSAVIIESRDDEPRKGNAA